MIHVYIWNQHFDFFFLHFRLIESRLLQVCDGKLPSVTFCQLSFLFHYCLLFVFFLLNIPVQSKCLLGNIYSCILWCCHAGLDDNNELQISYLINLCLPNMQHSCQWISQDWLHPSNIFWFYRLMKYFNFIFMRRKCEKVKSMILISKKNSVYLKVWIYKLNKSRLVMCKSLMARRLWRDC